MVTYSIQKEVFVNYFLTGVSVHRICTTMEDALSELNEVCFMPKTFPDLYTFKEMKVDDHGTKVTFYFDTPLIIRFRIAKHQL